MNSSVILTRAFRLVGLNVSRKKPLHKQFPDMDPEFFELYSQCAPHTMTSVERMYALYKAVEYVSLNKISGDIVECGVWQGGSCMMIALALKQFNDTERKIYLFDTYKGMPPPTAKDKAQDGDRLQKRWDANIAKDHNAWCYASLDDVKTHVASTGYPNDQFVFVEGKVEDTIPGTLPQEIALLRLDTDWYESTAHEMQHLYPQLVKHGVLIIDDYGHWRGSRQAVDEYLAQGPTPLLLNRVDYTGRTAIKP